MHACPVMPNGAPSAFSRPKVTTCCCLGVMVKDNGAATSPSASLRVGFGSHPAEVLQEAELDAGRESYTKTLYRGVNQLKGTNRGQRQQEAGSSSSGLGVGWVSPDEAAGM